MNGSGDLAVWIRNISSDRKQRVAVDGTLSNEYSVISGVSHGLSAGTHTFPNFYF